VSFPCQYDDIDVVFLYGLDVLGIGVLIVAVRTSAVVSWRNLPYPRWRMALEANGADGVVIILIYVDSYLFVCSTSILQVGVGLSNNHASCE
jgi:hypothetical protein